MSTDLTTFPIPSGGELRDGDPQVRITPKGAEEIRRRLDRGEQCAIGGAA